MRIGTIAPHRTVLLATSDTQLRRHLNASLKGLRWHVVEAQGGAEVLEELEQRPAAALLLDHWLPDLEISEFVDRVRFLYPGMDMLHFDGDPIAGCNKSSHRNELLYALREAVEMSRCNADPGTMAIDTPHALSIDRSLTQTVKELQLHADTPPIRDSHPDSSRRLHVPTTLPPAMRLEELIGESAGMAELVKMIHLVAPRPAAVLIEGETGTGKELVARAVHRLSLRSRKPLVVLNCAAIPEALLEAELFGHTRGAFTGATDARTGRIEAAQGGTLFLDEIGEMPLALQAKMLRFLDSGEIQKIGQNHNTCLDVRVIAATHQSLEKRVQEGTFRLDLYHRLAVFPLEVPPLRDRIGDIKHLCEHFLSLMAKTSPRKVLSRNSISKLHMHDWPGNVRELGHVLNRASILAGDRIEIGQDDIRIRRFKRVTEETEATSITPSIPGGVMSIHLKTLSLPPA